MEQFLSDGMPLGGLVALVIVAFAWNLGWRHYARYFLGPSALLQTRSAAGLRLFFLASLFGALWSLLSELIQHGTSITRLATAMIDGAIIAAVFFAFDGVFRWHWRRSGRSK